MNDEFFAKWSPRMLAILRIVTALIFIEHGTQKLFAFPSSGRGAVELYSLYGLAGTLEVFGGLAVLLGAFTRPVAFILAGEMAFAYFMGHAPRSFFPLLNGGDAAILYCFVFLYFSVAGSGALAVDRMRSSSRAFGAPAHGRAWAGCPARRGAARVASCSPGNASSSSSRAGSRPTRAST